MSNTKKLTILGGGIAGIVALITLPAIAFGSLVDPFLASQTELEATNGWVQTVDNRVTYLEKTSVKQEAIDKEREKAQEVFRDKVLDMLGDTQKSIIKLQTIIEERDRRNP